MKTPAVRRAIPNEGHTTMTNQINQKIVDAMTRQGDAVDAFIERHDATFTDLSNRVEEVEARASSPGKTAQTRETHEHKSRFEAWLRAPNDNGAKNALGDFESQLRKKNVNVTTAADGGFAVPEEIASQIERLELKFSPVRRLVRVMQTGSGDFKHLVNIRGATAGWVGESDTRSETVTPSLREVTPTHGELYAFPQTTEWALDDLFFNVGDWLAEEVAQQFAVEEGQAVLTGNGTNKPTGMLNTTPVATDDWASPLRAAAAYEFITSLSDDSPGCHRWLGGEAGWVGGARPKHAKRALDQAHIERDLSVGLQGRPVRLFHKFLAGFRRWVFGGYLVVLPAFGGG
jgi:HK97 family phage major capsid protein